MADVTISQLDRIALNSDPGPSGQDQYIYLATVEMLDGLISY
jgi:hypothetical protein